MIHAISPIDGRYASKTEPLSKYFSEFALIRARVYVEVEYFLFLINQKVIDSDIYNDLHLTNAVRRLSEKFNDADAEAIKKIESTINHDVKAVEYWLKQKLSELHIERELEFVHFGLTSQDINNTAMPLLIEQARVQVIDQSLESVLASVIDLSEKYKGVPMLARTHGQAASPTTVGKEMLVFSERLGNQLKVCKNVQLLCKFGGATGNFNAHKVAFPKIDWPSKANDFARLIGLTRSQHTTQIAHYDDLAELFNAYQRLNTILIDFCRDIWTYISMDYFSQSVNKNEVGSSAMPHKVNPIDFENAEGNLGIANALFQHLSEKLPISRLQRDLTDSTVLRNVGVPFGHSLIAYSSILKGIGKLELNTSKLSSDLDANWSVVAEAIQTILRREGYPKPYEALKSLTRGKASLTKSDIHSFVDLLDISAAVKNELKAISPHNYVGFY